MELRQVEGLPPGLLDAEAHQLAELLGGPTLLRLKGASSGPLSCGEVDARQRPLAAGLRENPSPTAGLHEVDLAPLFVSVLLHGNETSGWDGLRRFLRLQPALQCDLLIFIGNVEAAAVGLRKLPGQADFNRIWRPATGVAAELLAGIGAQPLLAAVDFHNNTGQTPHYAVLTDLSQGSLGLARLFADIGVYLERPDSVLTRAFAGRSPCIALELGPVGDPQAAERATGFLAALLNLDEPPQGAGDLRLYRALARVHPPKDAAFGFAETAEEDLDLVLHGDLQASNFQPLPAGTAFGVARNGACLRVLDNKRRDVTERFLEIRDGRILTTRTLIPAMYTADADMVRQDCLCYLMAPADSLRARPPSAA